MNSRPVFAALILFGACGLSAQSVVEEPREDPVLDAILEFKKNDREKANEVTVVLDAPEVDENDANPAPPDDSSNPADSSEPAAPAAHFGEAKAVEAADQPEGVQAAAAQRKGLAVRVEKLQTGAGEIDPSKVKLLAPFPAKPLSEAPAGWRLEVSDDAPPFTREVELAPGKTISLKVRPHMLVPEADGITAFSVAEPGFNPTLGYCQDSTVGAILSTSVRQLEDDSIALGRAVDELQQLLVSLPKEESEPEAAAAGSAKPKNATQPKR